MCLDCRWALQSLEVLATACTVPHRKRFGSSESRSVRLCARLTLYLLMARIFPLLCNNDNDNYVAECLSKGSCVYCVVIPHYLSSCFMKFYLYIVYKLILTLQFVSQFFACTESLLSLVPHLGSHWFLHPLECAESQWPETAAAASCWLSLL